MDGPHSCSNNHDEIETQWDKLKPLLLLGRHGGGKRDKISGLMINIRILFYIFYKITMNAVSCCKMRTSRAKIQLCTFLV